MYNPHASDGLGINFYPCISSGNINTVQPDSSDPTDDLSNEDKFWIGNRITLPYEIQKFLCFYEALNIQVHLLVLSIQPL